MQATLSHQLESGSRLSHRPALTCIFLAVIVVSAIEMVLHGLGIA
jgi:hypothetical protein